MKNRMKTLKKYSEPSSILPNNELSTSPLVKVVQSPSLHLILLTNYSLIYHTGLREFTGIVTLRNILELIISLVETLDQVYAKSGTEHSISKVEIEKRFVE